jgi:hypothetical protein
MGITGGGFADLAGGQQEVNSVRFDAALNDSRGAI